MDARPLHAESRALYAEKRARRVKVRGSRVNKTSSSMFFFIVSRRDLRAFAFSPDHDMLTCGLPRRGPSWIALRAAGMSPEDIDALILEIRDELKKIRNNMYCWV